MNFGGRLFFLYEIKEALLGNKLARLFLSFLSRGKVCLLDLQGASFAALAETLRLERDLLAISPSVVPSWVGVRTRRYPPGHVSSWQQLLHSYKRTKLFVIHRDKYCRFGIQDRVRIRQPKKNPPPERQGDLLVLKPWCGSREKGVILLNFDETVDKFFALFDVEKIAQQYRLVVEPSAWGYQQARMYLLRGLPTEVVVQSQYHQDYNYIMSLGGSLRAIRLGAGDWADPDIFTSGKETEKQFDVVMIANWLKWKRHRLLFQAIGQLKEKISKVALIGYPIEGRTSGEILELAKRYGVVSKIELFENIPPNEVARLIRCSKFGVMLSKKEGANRGIYECFFSDVPVVLTACNIGVNRDHINAMTGVLAEDDRLAQTIAMMLEKHGEMQPRAWALANTGAERSSKTLNHFLRGLAEAKGERWTQDIFPKKNVPTPVYCNVQDRLAADQEMTRLMGYLL